MAHSYAPTLTSTASLRRSFLRRAPAPLLPLLRCRSLTNPPTTHHHHPFTSACCTDANSPQHPVHLQQQDSGTGPTSSLVLSAHDLRKLIGQPLCTPILVTTSPSHAASARRRASSYGCTLAVDGLYTHWLRHWRAWANLRLVTRFLQHAHCCTRNSSKRPAPDEHILTNNLTYELTRTPPAAPAITLRRGLHPGHTDFCSTKAQSFEESRQGKR